jgi:hypothetical protein
LVSALAIHSKTFLNQNNATEDRNYQFFCKISTLGK